MCRRIILTSCRPSCALSVPRKENTAVPLSIQDTCTCAYMEPHYQLTDTATQLWYSMAFPKRDWGLWTMHGMGAGVRCPCHHLQCSGLVM